MAVEHSHVFGADGRFSSLDGAGRQVDFGRWAVVDDDTVEIGDARVRFDYTIADDRLTLEPQIEPGCRAFTCQWAVMVAMSWSGMERREP
jgi:hypothetical protein